MNVSVILSGLAVGTRLGFALQCGWFCLNRTCGIVFSIKEYTHLRTYVLPLILAVIAAHLLEKYGPLHLSAVRQSFAALANGLGAMSLALWLLPAKTRAIHGHAPRMLEAWSCTPATERKTRFPQGALRASCASHE